MVADAAALAACATRAGAAPPAEQRDVHRRRLRDEATRPSSAGDQAYGAVVVRRTDASSAMARAAWCVEEGCRPRMPSARRSRDAQAQPRHERPVRLRDVFDLAAVRRLASAPPRRRRSSRMYLRRRRDRRRRAAMIDHVSVAVRDLDAATRFYEAVLGAIGYAAARGRAATVGFGKKYPEFWLNLRARRCRRCRRCRRACLPARAHDRTGRCVPCRGAGARRQLATARRACGRSTAKATTRPSSAIRTATASRR